MATKFSWEFLELHSPEDFDESATLSHVKDLEWHCVHCLKTTRWGLKRIFIAKVVKGHSSWSYYCSDCLTSITIFTEREFRNIWFFGVPNIK